MKGQDIIKRNAILYRVEETEKKDTHCISDGPVGEARGVT